MFPDPDSVDIHRGDTDELAFGHGIHFCLGTRLAKLEGEVGFTALLRRFPDLSLVEPGNSVIPRTASWACRRSGPAYGLGCSSPDVDVERERIGYPADADAG